MEEMIDKELEEMINMREFFLEASKVMNDKSTWCQGATARDEDGKEINPENESAHSFSIEGIIKAFSPNKEIEKKMLELAANKAKIPIFLLEEWNDSKIRTNRDIVEVMIEITDDLTKSIAKVKNPDDRKEILDGKKDFGCVYIPTELLKKIWSIGINTRNGMKSIEKNDNLEEIKKMAAEWVQFHEERWGVIPNSEPVAVVPDEKIPF